MDIELLPRNAIILALIQFALAAMALGVKFVGRNDSWGAYLFTKMGTYGLLVPLVWLVLFLFAQSPRVPGPIRVIHFFLGVTCLLVWVGGIISCIASFSSMLCCEE